jgi:peptidoglycan/xylan/chitin deacetylase (PgdA/CDA1 family)/glycosyltransferase involved in cell wall biosynthesis/SAM-dependent methyltransferase
MPTARDSQPRMKPLVSVVFPLLNPGKFSEDASESVFAQSCGAWELIVVGDNSDDSGRNCAAEYAHRFPDRVTCVERARSAAGLSAWRNAGASRARGQYLAFLNAEDIWAPKRLSSQLALMKSQPLASVVYGLTEFWYSWTGNDSDLRRDFVPEAGVPLDFLYPPGKLLPKLYPLGPAMGPSSGDLLIAREFFERIGGFEEQFDGRLEDQAFLAKACAKGSLFVSGECLNRRRIHADAFLSGTGADAAQGLGRWRFLRWLIGYLDRENVTDPDVRTAVERALAAQKPPEEVKYGSWLFRVSGANDAELASPPDRPDAVRVSILRNDNRAAWDIQLSLRRQSLRGGQPYRVGFEARADKPRSIAVGVSLAREPWSGLGLYQFVDLTAEWERYEVEFTATADDEEARIHFDLAGAGIAVEITSVGLFHHDGRPAPNDVQFGALRRLTPISRCWGWDRGIPIDRYYIEKFLSRQAADIRGRVLEIGDNTYTSRFGGNDVTGSDVLHVTPANPIATIIGDLSDAPHIPDGVFDCIILTQTLQYVFDLRAAIRTLHRILRPGGVILATLPGISSTKDPDWSDTLYWNFTSLSARRLFTEAFPARDVEMEAFGNVLTATSFLHGLSAGELTTEEFAYADSGYEVTIGIRAIRREVDRARAIGTDSVRHTDRTHDGRALILMYHRVGEPDADPFSLTVSLSHFAEHLAVIRKQATPLSLPELADCVRRGRVPDGSVAVTFDDGYADNRSAKLLLERHSVPATVFVTTGNLGGKREFWWDELQRVFLTPGTLPGTLTLTIGGTPYRWELGEGARYSEEEFLRCRQWKAEDEAPGRRQSLYLGIWRLLRHAHETDRRRVIREIADWSGSTQPRETYRSLEPDEVGALAEGGLIEIGAHSVTHPALGTISAEEQRLEVIGSKHRLEEILGSGVASFAYPYGDMTGETVAVTSAAGFRQACSTVPRPVVRNANCMELPRFQVGDWDGAAFCERLAGWFGKRQELDREVLD